jgi:hypothetical protein
MLYHDIEAAHLNDARADYPVLLTPIPSKPS